MPRLGLVFGRALEGAGSAEGLHVLSAEGAAMLAGIEDGDCIVSFNGRTVSTVGEFDTALAAAAASRSRIVTLLVVREGVRAWLPVHLAQEPPARTSRP